MRHPEFAPFPTDEYVARYQNAKRLMVEQNLDALLLTSKENAIYFTGIQSLGWNSKHRPLGVLLPRADNCEPTIILAEALYPVARETSWIENLRPWGGWRTPGTPGDAVTAIHQAIVDLNLSHAAIGMELGYGHRIGMSQTDVTSLMGGFPGVKFVDASSLLWQLRTVKSPREVEVMRRAITVTTSAFEVGFAAMHSGMTERELAGVMFGCMAEKTGERPGFMMIRSGPRKYGMMNVPPFDKPMNEGELVVVDAGAMYKDYWADYMRMASMREPTAEQRRFFDVELEAQQAAVKAIKPGITTGQVFDACYEVFVKRGFKQHAVMERIGHGLGLDLHEPPSIGRGTTTVLQPGMVISVEPVFSDQPNYQIGNFAVEDDVLVTDGGHEVLSSFPRELRVINA